MILFFGANDSLAETNEPRHKLSHNKSIKESGEFGFSILYRERTVTSSNDSFITHTILDNTHTQTGENERPDHTGTKRTLRSNFHQRSKTGS